MSESKSEKTAYGTFVLHGYIYDHKYVAFRPAAWYKNTLAPQTGDESEAKDAVDEILVSDLECATCGGPVRGTCPTHDDQEVALESGMRIVCGEWDYERGRECRARLVLICEDCGEEAE